MKSKLSSIWNLTIRTRTGNAILAIAAALGFLLNFWFEYQRVTTVYLSVMTLAAGSFCLLYATKSQWRKTAPGRALMYSSLSLFLLGAQISATLIFGEFYPGRGVVRTILYLGLVIATLNLNLTLFRIQRHPFTEDYLEIWRRVEECRKTQHTGHAGCIICSRPFQNDSEVKP